MYRKRVSARHLGDEGVEPAALARYDGIEWQRVEVVLDGAEANTFRCVDGPRAIR